MPKLVIVRGPCSTVTSPRRSILLAVRWLRPSLERNCVWGLALVSLSTLERAPSAISVWGSTKPPQQSLGSAARCAGVIASRAIQSRRAGLSLLSVSAGGEITAEPVLPVLFMRGSARVKPAPVAQTQPSPDSLTVQLTRGALLDCAETVEASRIAKTQQRIASVGPAEVADLFAPLAAVMRLMRAVIREADVGRVDFSAIHGMACSRLDKQALATQ